MSADEIDLSWLDEPYIYRRSWRDVFVALSLGCMTLFGLILTLLTLLGVVVIQAGMQAQ